ncbi:MAG: hypothetical protein V3V53_12420 [Bacteroidales bacterium]
MFRLAGNSSFNLYLGPYLGLNYQFQLYPELQSGHLHWFTFYDLGPRLILEAYLWGQQFRSMFVFRNGKLISESCMKDDAIRHRLQ